ncbi:MAG TPA: hypothetical protein VKY15_00705, partial [Acidimicrobiales bacterium]|nr:hypothetical protein [Acidimicrobiales bacterium]
TVEGRFELGDDEIVISRVIPRAGRSRAWINGRMAPVAALAEMGARLVDLHGQHAHQSLLEPAGQRAVLDGFARIDKGPVTAAKARLRQVEEAIASLGGDPRSRAREIDLLRFQVDELERAGLHDDEEDARLAAEEERLAGASSHREAAEVGLAILTGDGVVEAEGRVPVRGAADAIGAVLSTIAGRPPMASVEARLRALAAELADVASELRRVTELLDDDPERLDAVRARRAVLRDLQRKYGDTLAEVRAYAVEARERLAQMESYEGRARQLEEERTAALAALAEAEAAQGWARRSAAPELSAAVEAHLRALAMPQARFEVRVGEPVSGDEVTFFLGSNPGEPVLPLSKVASGGELARAMLATRLVQASGPPTLVFDEVDSGIGGEAALAVGRALASLSRANQILVVTHLAQVAAFADHQVSVRKLERDGRTVAEAQPLDTPARVVELSRMLSGQPGSATAREHAEELLSLAERQRDLSGRRAS